MNIEVIKLNVNSENWARIYIEPDNRWSEGGGRITVNLGDDYLGSHFFSHVSKGSFKEFVSNCGSDYLVHKLFSTQSWISVEDANELFECVAKKHLFKVKDARRSGVSKAELRYLYEDIQGRDFFNTSDLSNQLDKDSCETMAAILGESWWYENELLKRNNKYDWQLKCIKYIQEHLKNQPH